MPQTVGCEDGLEVLAAGVGERVVGHYRLARLESELAEVDERALEHPRRRVGVFARVQLDIGVARVVVDDAVEIVVADPP